MAGSSVTPDRPPRNGLSAPESDEPPVVGTERHPRPPSGPQTGSQGLAPVEAPAPVQLALPEALLAAMRIPDAIPPARRRGRDIHTTPDLATYQPEGNR